MQMLTVMLKKDNPSYCASFGSILETLTKNVQTNPVSITYKTEEVADHYQFRFQSWSTEEYNAETIEIVHAFVSLAVVDWIFMVKEPETARLFAEQLMLAEDLTEWQSIYPYVQRLLTDAETDDPLLNQAVTRKAKVYRKVFEFIQENPQIHLQGFVRFRLKEYWNELFELVEAGIDDYLEDKQYEEFVDLLRYFISAQETKYDLVHVIPIETKHFLLYDEKGKLIHLDQLDAVLNMGEQKCREEDYLVSALVTIAPKRIVFHMADEKQALAQTINNIFDNRLQSCPSCPFCVTHRRILDVNKPTQL